MKRSIKIMGILNLTPDSFYSGSRYNMSILDSGADIIDIGACSTRPGHTAVGAEEEWKRLKPVLEMIARDYPQLTVSIDTYWSEVIRKSYDTIGDLIVNDVTAGDADPEMFRTVGELGLTYIPMHHETADNCRDILKFYERFRDMADRYGIRDWIMDPGFGFGKTVDQNYAVLDTLEDLTCEGHEVLVGISRKSMVYKRLGITADEALEGSCELDRKALEKGAGILRVHDVDAARKVISDYLDMMNTSSPGSQK